MGLIYDPGDSNSMMATLSANLSVARSAADDTNSACHRLVNSLETGELSGEGYSAVHLMFSQAIVPALANTHDQLEALENDLEKYRWEDSRVSRFGVLKEDELKTQLKATRAQRDATERLIEVNQSVEGALGALPFVGDALRDVNRRLELVLHQLEADVHDLEDRLRALRDFDAATRGLFQNDLVETESRRRSPHRRPAAAPNGFIQPASMAVPAAGAGIQQIAQWLMSGAYSVSELIAVCGAASVMAALALIVLGGVGTGSTSGSRFYTPEERVQRAWLDMYYWTHNPDGSVKQHIGPAVTPFTKYLDEAPTFEDVNEVLKGKTCKGNNSGVREVDSPEEVRDIYKEITRGSEPVEDAGSYPGERRKLPDGTEVGIREESTSGGVTIDIWSPAGKLTKVHLPKGWTK
ncbi:MULTISPECIES: hypothetical protein [unclassified Leifsonia]|uniref:hypothetical protein n=1 Tax=unclassified Leifsonia TaxID=2663824 RepID=UPI0008A7B785|nr:MULTISPECIES: hypothetical protein [unclassified Leifsonia]SEH79716.1 LXG domain of WXG superfamily protein [Leifsonia sp. CL154]SFL42054.1 LXG domain of WXG superfamily protein [Leifsonia sp. CL147]